MGSPGNSSTFIAHPSLSDVNDSSSVSLANTLSSCMDMLRIEDASVRKKAVELLGSVPAGTVNAFGKWITALKVIADSCALNGRLFSQSEVCDFLTVAAKGIDPKRSGAKAVNDSTFQIYVDIMENYQKSTQELKLHYPRIIVDTISALEKGVDTHGQSVGIYGVERYYQQRKQTVTRDNILSSYAKTSLNDSSRPTNPVYTDDLLDNLAHITGRSKRDLEKSLASLHQVDIMKISDLASNFKKLQKYSKMTNPSALKKEVEKELGRKLTGNQLQHAINSIRKANAYIENVLDGRFVPHGTHGINHVKHNLEYGYQLMGLMAPRRKANQ